MIVHLKGPRDVRGAVPISRIILLVCLVLVAAAAWWWFLKQHSPMTPTAITAPATAKIVAPAPGVNAPASEPATAPEMTVDELYTAARKALAENRMAAPAGDNALEYYLKIRELQPDNAGASDALRELFPYAVGAAETEIDNGSYGEATRIINLLAKADSTNYSLTILRSKLEANKKQSEREAMAAAKPPTPPPAPLQEPEPAKAAPETPPPVVATTPPKPPPVAARRPTPPPAVGETRDAQPISPLAPAYPPAAVRARQEGWVEVQFTVAADGSIRNAQVINSQPPRVFDSAAVRAAQAAKFRPKLVNGQPEDSVVRRRIEFKFNR